MAYRDLREFISRLEREGELKRIGAEVDWKLQVTEITDRTTKRGGPALLFENIKGHKTPLAINLFGSERQPGRYGVALYQLVPALRILTEMQLANGSLHVTAVDAERRRILFQQEDVKELKWPELREALEKVSPDTIDVEALAGRKQNAAYFREVLAERLKATDAAGSAARPQRVVIVLAGVVLSANDPVAAWGGVKLLRERFGVEPCVVTGPSTDNSVGVDIIKKQLGVPAFNAMSAGAALGDCVMDAVGLKGKDVAPEGAAA